MAEDAVGAAGEVVAGAADAAGEVFESFIPSATTKVLVAFALGGLAGVLIGFTVASILKSQAQLPGDFSYTTVGGGDNREAHPDAEGENAPPSPVVTPPSFDQDGPGRDAAEPDDGDQTVE